MSHLRTAAAAAAALALGVAGCGGGDGDGKSQAAAPPTTPSTQAAPGSPASIPTSPTATFIFDAGKLVPPVRRVPVATQVTLVLISADGKAHRATVKTPAGRVRVKVPARDRGEAVLRRLTPGTYRIVPKGADPAVLQVG